MKTHEKMVEEYQSLIQRKPTEVLGQEREKLDEESDLDSDNIYVLNIIKHKSDGQGNYRYLLDFSDKTQEYATESQAKIDCPDILKKYKANYFNNIKKPKKKRNKIQSQTTTRYGCSSDHGGFDSFSEEINENYFGMGQLLWKVKCRSCNIVIVDTETENGFRPSKKKNGIHLSWKNKRVP